ncbi:DNA sulfur modification protein DndB [Clostridium sp. C45]|uniref:DNA sulfur modification protein DndB n=1 Tax=Clostridium sp. 10cd* TaxID=3373596 RepID=UPI0037BEE0C7
MNYCFKFPVVRGVQANREYYIAMIPLKMLKRLFPEDDEYILPEYRAQRRVNESRIPVISKYILENENSYVFSALAASIDGEFNFISYGETDLGMLEISLDAKFLLNDGQHRKAAIEQALLEKPDLGDETISIVFYKDLGLKHSQQIFTDLNKHAVKTSNSIAELYDSRDELAVATRKIVESVSFFNEYVDKEKDMLGKYSSSLFTLNTIYTANKRILSKGKCNYEFVNFCIEYWKNISKNVVPWIHLQNKELSKKELREKHLAVQAVIMQAFGKLGNYFYRNRDIDMNNILCGLKKINWSRNADCWYLRVIKENGRMINNEKAIALATNMLKISLEIGLSENEENIEKEFNENRGRI